MTGEDLSSTFDTLEEKLLCLCFSVKVLDDCNKRALYGRSYGKEGLKGGVPLLMQLALVGLY